MARSMCKWVVTRCATLAVSAARDRQRHCPCSASLLPCPLHGPRPTATESRAWIKHHKMQRVRIPQFRTSHFPPFMYLPLVKRPTHTRGKVSAQATRTERDVWMMWKGCVSAGDPLGGPGAAEAAQGIGLPRGHVSGRWATARRSFDRRLCTPGPALKFALCLLLTYP